jgi:hypothetical protein
MPRSMLQIPNLAPRVSITGSAFSSLPQTIQMLMLARDREIDNQRQQQAVDQLNQFRQSEIENTKAGQNLREREFNATQGALADQRAQSNTLAAQARKDAELKDNRGLAQWMTANMGGKDITNDPQTQALYASANMTGALDRPMTLPASQFGGLGSVLPDRTAGLDSALNPSRDQTAGEFQFQSPQAAPVVPNGHVNIGMTMDDKMRAADIQRQIQEAKAAAQATQFAERQAAAAREHDLRERNSASAADARRAQIDLATERFNSTRATAAAKESDKQAAARTHIDTLQTEAADTRDVLNRLLDHPGLPGIMGLQGVFPNMPGGAAAGAMALYKNIEPRLAVEKVNELKAAGNGNLGFRLTQGEILMFAKAAAALDRSQSLDEWKTNATILRDYLNKIATGQSAQPLQNGTTATVGVPKVGGTFNGGKVLKVEPYTEPK